MNSVEHSPQSSRVILSGHHDNGLEVMLVAPSRKHPAFIFGSIDSGDLHDIRHAKRSQLANLPCTRILIGEPRRMNSKSSPLGGSIKTATRVEMPLRTRSAASSAPAPPDSSDKTMMSAGRDRFVYDKRPSCGSQNRLPWGANCNDRKRGQREHHQDRGPPRPPEDHTPLAVRDPHTLSAAKAAFGRLQDRISPYAA